MRSPTRTTAATAHAHEVWAGRLAELAESGIDSYNLLQQRMARGAVADAAMLRAALGSR